MPEFVWIILLILLFLLLVFVFYYYIQLFRGIILTNVPYVSSFDSEINLMWEKLNIDSNKNIIDLGCGNGKALRFFLKKFNLRKGVWYDLNGYAIRYGKFLNKIRKIDNLELYCKNFKKVDISNFDYIYTYLLPQYMAKIEDWVFQSIWKNTIIVSNSFQFSKHKPFKIIKNGKWKDKIFLYKKDN